MSANDREFMHKIVLASNNAGKLREFTQLLEPIGWGLIAQGQLGVGEAEEPHQTFIENALAKARHASALTGLPALADDSGICVPLLGGAPGVLSARYAGEPKDDAANNRKLVSDLQAMAHHDDEWSAFFVCVLVLVRHEHDPLPLIAEGRWWGRMVPEARGAGGFGYDPHFLVVEQGRTAAELDAEQKHALSHRGQALRALVELLSHERRRA